MPRHLLYLTARDCHLCAFGRPIVARLADDTSASLRELDWEDSDARALIDRDGVPFPPALYLDDRLLGFGRLSERRLRRAAKAVTV